MKQVQWLVLLELPDYIRMNRLVRGGVDQAGFEAWWVPLPDPERRALADTLIACAWEAGVSEELHLEALELAGLALASPWAQILTREICPREGKPPWVGLQAIRNTLRDATGDELERFLRWGACVFGLAEGRVFAAETPAACNHWWHRDLNDERVVADLLANPRYMFTSMRDDARIQGC